MSEREERSRQVAEQEQEEAFLTRWARLKRQSRQPAAEPAADDSEKPRAQEPDQPAQAGAPPSEEVLSSGQGVDHDTGVAELPSLESLTEESDFSPFMKAGVDPDLQRQALRKMWRNPKYAFIDELDPYRADYKAFTALGDILTADMKYHAARLLQEQMEKAAAAAESSESPREDGAGEAAEPLAEDRDERQDG